MSPPLRLQGKDLLTNLGLWREEEPKDDESVCKGEGKSQGMVVKVTIAEKTTIDRGIEEKLCERN